MIVNQSQPRPTAIMKRLLDVAGTTTVGLRKTWLFYGVEDARPNAVKDGKQGRAML